MSEENKSTETAPESEQQETTTEIHTEHEAELEKRVVELTEQVKQLIEENRKLYLKVSGTNTDTKEKTLDEELKETIKAWAESGFNPEKLFS